MKDFIQIIDHLLPKMDVYEQVFYLYMFRHTILENKTEIKIPLSSIHEKVSFGIGRMGAPISRQVVRTKMKSLEEKGFIKKLKTTKSGILYKIYLPNEIEGIIPKNEETIVNLEDLDFYNNRTNRLTLLERENYRCFYCLTEVTTDDYFIDHVTPQVDYGNNSYKNCVVSCINCNSNKQGVEVDVFIRNLFRKNLISESEFANLNQKLLDLKNGNLVPIMKRL